MLTLSNTLADCRESALAAQDKQSVIAAMAQISMLLDLITFNNFEYHSHAQKIVYLIKLKGDTSIRGGSFCKTNAIGGEFHGAKDMH